MSEKPVPGLDMAESPAESPAEVSRLYGELDKARRKIEALERAVLRQSAAQAEREQRFVNVRSALIKEMSRKNAALRKERAPERLGRAPERPERAPDARPGGARVSVGHQLAQSLTERRRTGARQPAVAAPETEKASPEPKPAPGEPLIRAIQDIETLDRTVRDLQFRRAHAAIQAEEAAGTAPDEAVRAASEIETIRSSGLFDEARYLKKVPSAVDTVARYVAGGLDENANPHPVFAHRWYIVRYAKLLAGWRTPFAHFLAVGWKKGCDPHPLFRTRWYLAQYDDVKQAGANPFVHFMTRGHLEGRNPNPVFDTAWYRETYLEDGPPDANPLIDYIFSGKRGVCEPSPEFDTKLLTDLYPRIHLPETNPLAHLLSLDQGEIDQALERMRAARQKGA